MKKMLGLLLGAGGVAFAILYYKKSTQVDQTDHERYHATLRQLQHLDTTFNQEALKVRFNILSYYDDFSVYQEEMADAAAELSMPPGFVTPEQQQNIAVRLSAYRRLEEQRAELFETFKSQNAVLKNSMRYFPTACGQFITRIADQPENRPLERSFGELMREVLNYGIGNAIIPIIPKRASPPACWRTPKAF